MSNRYDDWDDGRYGNRYSSRSDGGYGSRYGNRSDGGYGSRPDSGYGNGYGNRPDGRSAARRDNQNRDQVDARTGSRTRGERTSASPTPRTSRARSDYSRSNGSYAARSAAGRRRKLAIAAIAVAAVLLVGAGIAFAYVGSIAGNLNEGVDDDLRNALVETDMANEPFYVLLLGTDRSAERSEDASFGDMFRSDSIMLARVDPVERKVTLVSIPRDLLVDLGEYGYQRINAAYGFGGPALAVKTVSETLGIDISHYAEIDFEGFSAIVDALGGIEVDVPVEIDDWEAGGYVPAGLQTLDGTQALILCRSRNTYVDTSAAPDLMRAANQRMVLSAIARKALSSDVATIASTVAAMSEFVTTDLGLNDIVGIAQIMRGIEPDTDIYTAALPTESIYVFDGAYAPDPGFAPTGSVDPDVPEGWYMLLENAEWKTMRKRLEEGLSPAESAVVDEATGTVLATAGDGANDTGEKTCWITVKNGTDRDGLAAYAMALLDEAGFVNVTIGNAAEGYAYPETLVIYDEPGRAREAAQIVEALGQGQAFENDGSYYVENNFLVLIGDDWE